MPRLAGLLLVALLLTGCAGATTPEDCDGDSACAAQLVCAPVTTAEVRHNASPAPTTAPGTAELTLTVTNRSGPAERVVVRAGDLLLLDALLPPGSDYCQGEPVFAWSYDLTSSPTDVTVVAAGQEVTVVVDDGQTVRVSLRDDLPLDVQVAAA